MNHDAFCEEGRLQEEEQKEEQKRLDEQYNVNNAFLCAGGLDCLYSGFNPQGEVYQAINSKMQEGAVTAGSLAVPLGGAARLTLWIKNLLGLKVTSNLTLLFGKNAKGHLIKHADALGFAGKTPQQLQKMVPELKNAANKLLQNADPKLTKVGQWHQHQGAKMHISNGKMIVTESNGTFITVINKTTNKWYHNAQ